MKLLALILYQSCNQSCVDCPMKQWTYEPDAVDENGNKINNINNKLLLRWIDKYLDPKEWFIEITGGEPGLYPEIKKLIPSLTNRGYKGLIRTNGSLLIPGLPSFKRIAAWHKDQDFPKFYDFILILENPDDDWQAKEQYCKDNGIPYAVFPYVFFSTDGHQTTTYPSKMNSLFREMIAVNSSGQICRCYSAAPVEGYCLQNMSEPAVNEICLSCGSINALEYFIGRFKDEYNLESEKLPEADLSSLTVYPILDTGNNWIDEDGNIVGKLGDNLEEINSNYAKRRGK